MRKGIQLKVILWIEGEDEPAHDFAASTTQAVRQVIARGQRAAPTLKIQIRSITEETDEEDGTNY